MDLDRLHELKNMIVSATSFGDLWDYFFDHFGDKPEFMDLGGPTEHPMLEAVVERLGREIYKDARAVVVTKPILVKLEDYQFIHGSFVIQGRMGVLIFFEDIDMGLMSLTAASKDTPTLMMRFSTYQVDKDKAIHLNPRTSGQVN